MEHTYKKILPEDLFVSLFERAATEEERWKGMPQMMTGNWPSGCIFMDCFARLVHRYQHADIRQYGKMLGLSANMLAATVHALSGIEAAEWRDRYVMLGARELLLTTDLSITEIAKRLGFVKCTTFSRFFSSQTKISPKVWRYRHKR